MAGRWPPAAHASAAGAACRDKASSGWSCSRRIGSARSTSASTRSAPCCTEIFARVSRVEVRHRFFHDEASLLHWCRQLLFQPEPAVLVVTGHGEANGLTVGGRIIDMRRMVDSLRFADSLQLLHFSACLVGQNAGEALSAAPFPVSGYTTRVDWAESALTEFIYLDMMLEKRLPPAQAAEQLVRLVRFAGDEPMPGSPYHPAGFRFFPATDPPEPTTLTA